MIFHKYILERNLFRHNSAIRWEDDKHKFADQSDQVQKSREKLRRRRASTEYRWLSPRQSLGCARPVEISTLKVAGALSHRGPQTHTHTRRSQTFDISSDAPQTGCYPSRPRCTFTGGTPRSKTQQVGKGKKERDWSNWIHRFLRN